MKGWENKYLEELIEFHDSKRIPLSGTERATRQGKYRYYGAQGIIDYIDNYIFDGEYILVAEDGENLRTRNQPVAFKIDGQFWVNNHAHIITAANGKSTNDFLLYLINHISLDPYITGAAQPKLSQANMRKIKVQVPPLLIQQKIAAILAAYDDLIENNLKRIKLLEEMAQITYEEWFVRLRFPKHESTPINPETSLPEGWEIKKLGEVTALIKRGISPQYVESGGLTVINQKCVRDHNVNLEVARQTSSSKKVPSEKMLKKYDVLINSTGTGTLGRVAQYFFDALPATVDTHVTIARASEGISSLYLGRFLERNEPYLEQLGKGATNQKELSATDISNAVEIVIPDQDTQKKYHHYCECIFAEVTALNAQNILLREARDILLPRLMTGVIDVKSYDPAGLLKEAA